jgi:hypothetical protein
MRRFLTQRPSQQVHESISPVTPGGHVSIVMERTSTGGTRHQAEMKRKTGTAMSGAERAEKNRRKATLFPAKEAKTRENDAERKRKAPRDASAQRQGDAAEEAERAATASSSSSAEVRQARDQHTTLLRLTFGDTVEEAELAVEDAEDAEERQQWLDMP